MTITSLAVRNEYTASAGQTVFNYTFKIYTANDLNIYITPSGQDADDSADLTTAYTVDVGTIGDSAGGFITLNVGTSLGDLVTIVSSIVEDRTTDYQNSGDFLPDVVNEDFDRTVSIAKQTDDRSGRTLGFQESLQNATNLSVPNPSALLFMRWKADLTGLENIDLTATGTPTDSSVITYDPPFTGSTLSDVETKLSERLTAGDFGAVGNGIANDTAAFIALFAQLTDGNRVTIAPGTYILNTDAIGCELNDITFDAYGATFITSDASGLLFNLNTASIVGTDPVSANVKRNVKWFGGKFLNTNGTLSATNNTCTAIRGYSVKSLTIEDTRIGAAGNGENGQGWHRAIDASGFDGIYINRNSLYANDIHIFVDDVYTSTNFQNLHITNNQLLKCYDKQIFIDTALSDSEISYNDTAQPLISGSNYPTFISLKTGNGASFATRGVRIIGNNTEQHQGLTTNLIEIVSDGAQRASDIDILENTLIGNNNNINLDECFGKIQINGNFFLTTSATAVKATNIRGSVTFEGNEFAQLAGSSGTLVDMQFAGSTYQYNWGGNETPKTGMGAITWSHTGGLSTVDRFRRTDCPILFGAVRNGDGTVVVLNDVESSVFDKSSISTGITDLDPIQDIGAGTGTSNLFAHNNDVSLLTAVLLKVRVNDSGSFAGAASVRIYPKGLDASAIPDYSPLIINLAGTIDDKKEYAQAWVPLGTDLKFTVDVVSSSGSAMQLGISYGGFK